MNIEIIGAGIVGKSLGTALIEKGNAVHFVDTNIATVQILVDEGYNAMLPASAPDLGEVTFICVPTPTTDDIADYNALQEAARSAASRLHRDAYSVIVVKSTVLPGVTEQLVIPTIMAEASDLLAGEHFGVCVSPEYVRERYAVEDARHPRALVIGELDKRSGDVLDKLYDVFDAPRFRMSIKAAEFQKYVHNLYNTVKISFFNEMREIARYLGEEVDAACVFNVATYTAEGLWNPTYGTRDWGAFQGSCLPKDTAAFLGWSRSNQLSALMIEAAQQMNHVLMDSLQEENAQDTHTMTPNTVLKTPEDYGSNS